MATWHIEIVRGKLERLGTGTAANVADAIVKPTAEFNIPELSRNRLLATQIRLRYCDRVRTARNQQQIREYQHQQRWGLYRKAY
jgi:hypothetical protein